MNPHRKEFIKIIIKRLKKRYPDQMHTQLKYSNNWELLIAVILSAKTKDLSVNIATSKLFKKFKSPEDYLNIKEKDLYP